MTYRNVIALMDSQKKTKSNMKKATDYIVVSQSTCMIVSNLDLERMT